MSPHVGHKRSKLTLVAAVLAAGSLGCFGLPQIFAPASAGAEEAGAPLQSAGPQDEGVGMYTDPSVAFQLSSFSITRRLVSCGVGTLAGPGPGQPGPFSMLMYSTKIARYEVDRGSPSRIMVEGTMRSITRMGNQTNEDVEHAFKAVAVDNHGSEPDSFMVHFVTPFWNHDNPMATKSTLESGWVQFGGKVAQDASGAFAGDVIVNQ